MYSVLVDVMLSTIINIMLISCDINARLWYGTMRRCEVSTIGYNLDDPLIAPNEGQLILPRENAHAAPATAATPAVANVIYKALYHHCCNGNGC
jgi:hypothetical protein